MATLVGPKAVHMRFASRPSRWALRSASAMNVRVAVRSSTREAATAPVRNSEPYTDTVGTRDYPVTPRSEQFRSGLGELCAGGETTRGVQGVRHGSEQRPEHHRVLGQLGGGEAAFSGDPDKVGLPKLGEDRSGGLVAPRQKALCPAHSIADGGLRSMQRVREHQRDAAGDVAVAGGLVGVEHIAQVSPQRVEVEWLAGSRGRPGEQRSDLPVVHKYRAQSSVRPTSPASTSCGRPRRRR